MLFKAKAYLDLSARKERGEKVDFSDIKKHKRDVLRLTAEMVLNPVTNLPQAVLDDIHLFIAKLDEEPFDDNSLKTYRTSTGQITERLERIFET